MQIAAPRGMAAVSELPTFLFVVLSFDQATQVEHMIRSVAHDNYRLLRIEVNGRTGLTIGRFAGALVPDGRWVVSCLD